MTSHLWSIGLLAREHVTPVLHSGSYKLKTKISSPKPQQLSPERSTRPSVALSINNTRLKDSLYAHAHVVKCAHVHSGTTDQWQLNNRFSYWWVYCQKLNVDKIKQKPVLSPVHTVPPDSSVHPAHMSTCPTVHCTLQVSKFFLNIKACIGPPGDQVGTRWGPTGPGGD